VYYEVNLPAQQKSLPESEWGQKNHLSSEHPGGDLLQRGAARLGGIVCSKEKSPPRLLV
jgi:hypothetical protein